eukprot:5461721-Amphidinium_carterae.1
MEHEQADKVSLVLLCPNLLPASVGQALQVAPSEIHSQVLVRDADIYEDYEIAAFEIRRQGEDHCQMQTKPNQRLPFTVQC